MKHLFIAQKLGWNKDREAVWFDSDYYSVEEATKQFKPVHREIRRGKYSFDSTEYHYDGQRYHDFNYVGTYDRLPKGIFDFAGMLAKKGK